MKQGILDREWIVVGISCVGILDGLPTRMYSFLFGWSKADTGPEFRRRGRSGKAWHPRQPGLVSVHRLTAGFVLSQLLLSFFHP